MPRYVAIINTPGCLPEDENPPTFGAPWDAWSYLCEERERAEDDADTGNPELDDYSPTRETLAVLGTRAHWGHSTTREWLSEAGLDLLGCGVVYGPTPGYDGDHDKGLAYCVVIDEDPVTT